MGQDSSKAYTIDEQTWQDEDVGSSNAATSGHSSPKHPEQRAARDQYASGKVGTGSKDFSKEFTERNSRAIESIKRQQRSRRLKEVGERAEQWTDAHACRRLRAVTCALLAAAPAAQAKMINIQKRLSSVANQGRMAMWEKKVANFQAKGKRRGPKKKTLSTVEKRIMLGNNTHRLSARRMRRASFSLPRRTRRLARPRVRLTSHRRWTLDHRNGRRRGAQDEEDH